MKNFIVEGFIQDAQRSTDEIMKEHMAYTSKAMDDGRILLSGLKPDMSGAVFVMKVQSEEELEAYLANEPFKLYGIQEYKYMEFDVHYMNKSLEDWIA